MGMGTARQTARLIAIRVDAAYGLAHDSQTAAGKNENAGACGLKKYYNTCTMCYLHAQHVITHMQCLGSTRLKMSRAMI